MASITVNLRQWTEFHADLVEHLNGGYTTALQAGGDRAGAKIDELVRSNLPPAQQSSHPSPLRTAKQKRWWWATMSAKANGKSTALPGWKAVYKRIDGRKTLVISGHYKRTGKLMQSMTWRTEVLGDGVTVTYGSNRVYAPYVVGDPADPDPKRRQALIHQSNWTPLIHIIRSRLDVITQAFIDGAWPVIKRDLGKD